MTSVSSSSHAPLLSLPALEDRGAQPTRGGTAATSAPRAPTPAAAADGYEIPRLGGPARRPALDGGTPSALGAGARAVSEFTSLFATNDLVRRGELQRLGASLGSLRENLQTALNATGPGRGAALARAWEALGRIRDTAGRLGGLVGDLAGALSQGETAYRQLTQHPNDPRCISAAALNIAGAVGHLSNAVGRLPIAHAPGARTVGSFLTRFSDLGARVQNALGYSCPTQ